MNNPTTENDDDWTTAAMTDDSLVADLLLKMKHSPPPPFRRKSLSDMAPATWGNKQPRSVPASASKESLRKSAEWISRRRSSPSTPLSWSGGSGAVDGSSYPSNQSPSYRSKISLAGGSQINGASSSKPRKKKTYAELKVEEDKLLMEKVQLHQKIAMLDAIVKEHREENESLKSKLDSITHSTTNVCTDGVGGPKVASSKEAIMKREQHNRDSLASISSGSTPASRPCQAESDSISGKKKQNLMLPDLNMMPSEQEFTNSSNILRSMQSKPHTNK